MGDKKINQEDLHDVNNAYQLINRMRYMVNSCTNGSLSKEIVHNNIPTTLSKLQDRLQRNVIKTNGLYIIPCECQMNTSSGPAQPTYTNIVVSSSRELMSKCMLCTRWWSYNEHQSKWGRISMPDYSCPVKLDFRGKSSWLKDVSGEWNIDSLRVENIVVSEKDGFWKLEYIPWDVWEAWDEEKTSKGSFWHHHVKYNKNRTWGVADKVVERKI